MKKFLIYLVLLLQTFFAAAAFAAPAIPPKPSASSGIYVQDYAGVIQPEDKQKILSIGQDLDNKTTAQVAVVTVKSLEGQPIDEYALSILREWGIGTKGKDNGVLIVVATQDRKSRIEVGYGLEGILHDGRTGRIQDKYMIPYFSKGDYSTGILQGYLATSLTIAKSANVELTGARYNGGTAQKQDSGFDLGNILLIAAIVIILIIDNVFLGGFLTQTLLWSLIFRRGGGGGSGGGFGGGSGGGGGSSRNW